MTASGEANMEIRDAMLTLPTNSCRAGWSRKAMLACAMTANTKASSARSPTILSCGEGAGKLGHLLRKWRRKQAFEDRVVGPVILPASCCCRRRGRRAKCRRAGTARRCR